VIGRAPVLAAVAAAAVLITLVAAGCGGGGSSSSSSGGDFASQANAACAAANEQAAALPAPKGGTDLVTYLVKNEEIVAQLHSKLVGLEAPSESKAAVAKYLSALEEAEALLNEMANAARNANPDAVKSISREVGEIEVGALAKQANLSTCAESPTA
jgi:hypothetical protein